MEKLKVKVLELVTAYVEYVKAADRSASSASYLRQTMEISDSVQEEAERLTKIEGIELFQYAKQSNSRYTDEIGAKGGMPHFKR